MSMKTIAIANHKGGVGKTATTHALGEALALHHHQRVLLIDNDAQASLTGVCDAGPASPNLADLLAVADIQTAAIKDYVVEILPNLHIIPGDIALALVEMELYARPNRVNLLKNILLALQADYDVALIDCAPYLGLLTMNALLAADVVLIPTQAQAIDLRGLNLFLKAIEQVQQDLNPQLEILGILVTFFDQRLNHHKDALAAMQESGLPVFDTKIGRSVRVAEAAIRGQSIVSAEPKNPQAKNYSQLAEWVNRWLDGTA